MLEWMIAIVALCGAIAGFAALYLALRFALQLHDGVSSRGAIVRRWSRRRARGPDDTTCVESALPRARVLRGRRPRA